MRSLITSSLQLQNFDIINRLPYKVVRANRTMRSVMFIDFFIVYRSKQYKNQNKGDLFHAFLENFIKNRKKSLTIIETIKYECLVQCYHITISCNENT